jgi:hypothetical protein
VPLKGERFFSSVGISSKSYSDTLNKERN